MNEIYREKKRERKSILFFDGSMYFFIYWFEIVFIQMCSNSERIIVGIHNCIMVFNYRIE